MLGKIIKEANISFHTGMNAYFNNTAFSTKKSWTKPGQVFVYLYTGIIMPKLNMKAVQRLTGLGADTLRAWEKRYQAVSPGRNAAGRREYSPSEVQRLSLLATLVRAGRSISSITGLNNDQLLSEAAPMQGALDSRVKLDDQISKLLSCLKVFDLAKLNIQLRQLLFELSPRDFIFYFIPQIMTLIGNLSEKGIISVPQEHVMSEIFGTYLRKIYEDFPVIEKNGTKPRTVLLAIPEGEYHEFGLLISGIVCRQKGFHTIYLGPNLPIESLSSAVNSMKPTPFAILISVTQIPPKFIKSPIEKYIKQLIRHIPKSCSIWLGGSRSFELRDTRFRDNLKVFESIEEFEQKIEYF